jgi:Concanavalin A-like lectin/glucanases superfamily
MRAIQQLLLAAGPSAAHDTYWTNVKLLMGFNGANNSTGAPGMTDESSAAHGNASVVNTAVISTAQSVFGGSSLALDGASYISYPDSADWDFSNQPFTVECRFYTNSLAGGVHMIVGQWFSAGNLGWELWLNGSSLQFLLSDDGTTNRTVATTTIAANTWYAVAVDFDGSKYRMYINGAMVSSSSTLYTINNSPIVLGIGASSNGPSSFINGFVDELRLTKGVARYASDSGYTVAVSAFPRS